MSKITAIKCDKCGTIVAETDTYFTHNIAAGYTRDICSGRTEYAYVRINFCTKCTASVLSGLISKFHTYVPESRNFINSFNPSLIKDIEP